ncbi:MAG: exodeoxyribonuclease V subunit alpha [Thermodesulfobacteriota bacterium]|nr:exodeoxyribonuclease V subunit alpha [Thermodesulfobacteriota bacterium]
MLTMKPAIDITALKPVLGELDIRFGELMTALDADVPADALFPAAALASWASRRGHVCLDLGRADALLAAEGHGTVLPPPGQWHEQWRNLLLQSRVVGQPGDFTPLVMDRGMRLYLHRYWSYENELADFIGQRYHRPVPVDKDLLADGIQRLFPAADQAVNMQAVAAVSALIHGFCVVSGGPGTGKTTTVAAILALLAEQAAAGPGGRTLEIALAAPTGKAAARLGEAVSAARLFLDSPTACLDMLPDHASTIHRLLGSMRDSAYFRYNRHHKLPADVVVVDEASMVDLALMAKLVTALQDHCRLILVGDRNQLSSVAAGSVFADICGAGGVNVFSSGFYKILADMDVAGPAPARPGYESRPGDAVVGLDRNYRFDPDSGISRLGLSVREGDGRTAMAVLADEGFDDVRWHHGAQTDLHGMLADKIIRWVSAYMGSENDPAACFEVFDGFRILCALREGPFGATTLNRRIEQMVRHHQGVAEGQQWYPGRPVMIVRNDYQRLLFNGDVGLTLSGPDNRLQVFFQGPDGVRAFYPNRLPDHETAFAMTVHKSQGAEFTSVFVILPDTDAPVLTRPLLYTAITRAKSFVEIAGEPVILETAMGRDTLRVSGLSDAIYGQLGQSEF